MTQETRKRRVRPILALLAAALLTTPAFASADGLGQVVVSRDLLFSDRADGAVVITNAANGETISVLAPESHAFIRALMRGLVRQRVRESQGPEVPFRLTAWSSGALVLDDPATHRSVELAAFGPTNEADFVELLPLPKSHKTGEAP